MMLTTKYQLNKKLHDLALSAGGSFYPDVAGENLEKFTRLLLEECAIILEQKDTDSKSIKQKLFSHFQLD